MKKEWHSFPFAQTQTISLILISNYAAISELDYNSIIMSFENWIDGVGACVVASAAATLSARKALSKAIRSTKAATKRIILCTK